MSVLYALAGIRTPFLNEVMLLLTNFGDETILLIIAMLLFWCVDKRRGYRTMITAFTAMGITMLIKVLVMEARPWVMDPAFTAVEAAKAGAYDYCFPSGHSSTAAALYGSLALYTKRKPLRIIYPCCALLVGFTRLYLGVHHPLDVLVGLIIGFGCALAWRPVLLRTEDNPWTTSAIHAALVAFLVLSLIIQHLKPVTAAADPELDAVTMRDTGSMLGAALAMTVSYRLERRYIRFENHTGLPVQLLRLSVGFLLVLAVRLALKAVLPVAVWSNALRYFLMMLTGVALWPMCFARLDRLCGQPLQK